MRKIFTPRGRRYGLALAVLAASAGVLGTACAPTKTPPPPKAVCFGGPGACLTIVPPSWTFTAQSEVHTFTVKNTGPDQSDPLRVETLGGNATPTSFVVVQDNCSRKTLVVGDSCTVGAQSFANVGEDTNLLVGSDNSQLDAELGQRGVKAPISRQ
jgi:hypothetical protein